MSDWGKINFIISLYCSETNASLVSADASDDETPAAPAAVAAPTLKKKSKFADEDASDDDIKVSYSPSFSPLLPPLAHSSHLISVACSQDDWDASDDEKPAPVKPTGPPPPVRAKGITKQKIAEKEAAEKARLESIAARVS